uniref:Putative secreted peptide n=1 Tax=Anopheles braziliensis TaxID=58242 RepID=A0A2M3ZUG4_9DIPT
MLMLLLLLLLIVSTNARSGRIEIAETFVTMGDGTGGARSGHCGHAASVRRGGNSVKASGRHRRIATTGCC